MSLLLILYAIIILTTILMLPNISVPIVATTLVIECILYAWGNGRGYL